MKMVKMICALLLCAAIALTGCVFAEEADGETAEVSVIELSTGLTVQTVVPEGYSYFSYDLGENVPAGLLCFVPEDDARIYMMMDINYDEEVAGMKSNDFSDEQFDDFRQSIISNLDMLNPTVTVTETAYGTKLLVFDENSENDEYVIIATLYDGHWIDLLLYHEDVTVRISQEEIQAGIDLLSNTWFISPEDDTEDPFAAEDILAGGWTAAEDQTVTAELSELFDKAFEGFAGASYEPLAFLGTQVVAGLNYRFLVKQTLVTAQPVVTYGYLTLYCDLEGNVTFNDFVPVGVNDLRF